MIVRAEKWYHDTGVYPVIGICEPYDELDLLEIAERIDEATDCGNVSEKPK